MAYGLLELKQDIDEYSHWVDMGWHLCAADQDDVLPIISIRDDLHHYIKKIGIEDIPVSEIERLKHIDKKWQNWLHEHRDEKFRYSFTHLSEIPQSRWWWYIDRMDELTSSELETV